jgi:hypothetical protein
MRLKEFHKRFEALDHNTRYSLIELPPEPTSIFVIYSQLAQARAQRKYFEDREEHLLKLADVAFKKLNEKNGVQSEGTQ